MDLRNVFEAQEEGFETGGFGDEIRYGVDLEALLAGKRELSRSTRRETPSQEACSPTAYGV